MRTDLINVNNNLQKETEKSRKEQFCRKERKEAPACEIQRTGRKEDQKDSSHQLVKNVRKVTERAVSCRIDGRCGTDRTGRKDKKVTKRAVSDRTVNVGLYEVSGGVVNS